MWKMWNVENVEIQRDSLFLCLVILTHCKIILLLTSTLIKQGDARQHSPSVTLVNKVRHGAQWEITPRIATRRSAPPTQRLGSEKVYFRGFRKILYLCIVRRENEDFDERTRRRVFLTREREDEFFDEGCD
jgi:hypothetical protein